MKLKCEVAAAPRAWAHAAPKLPRRAGGREHVEAVRRPLRPAGPVVDAAAEHVGEALSRVSPAVMKSAGKSHIPNLSYPDTCQSNEVRLSVAWGSRKPWP